MWNSPNAQVENCTNNSRSLGLYFTEKGGGQMSGNNQFPMESKTWKIHYQNWKKGLGLISQLGDSLLSALGADEFIRDIGPSDPGTREVNPCQAVTAFNHWPASKGFTTVTRHSIVTIVNVTIIYVDKKIDMCLPKALHNLHLPESLSEDTFLSSPLLDEGVSDLVLSEPVLPIGLLALDLNSYYSTRMFWRNFSTCTRCVTVPHVLAFHSFHALKWTCRKGGNLLKF